MKNDIQNNDLTFSTALFAVFLCILFGGNAVAIKTSFKGIAPFTDTSLRFSMAAFAIFIWTRVTGKSLRIKNGEFIPILIIAGTFTVQMSIFHFGLSITNALRTSLIVNLQPFLLLFMAHFFIPGDTITARKLIGLIAGFAGLVFVFIDNNDVTRQFRFGDLLVFGSTFLWASVTVYTKRVIHWLDPYKFVFYQMLFALPFFYTESILFDTKMIFNLNLEVILGLIYQGLVTASFGFIAWSHLLRQHGAVALHAFVFIMPIIGIFFSWLLLDEAISSNLLIALLFIVFGIIIVHARGAKLSVFPFRRTGFE